MESLTYLLLLLAFSAPFLVVEWLLGWRALRRQVVPLVVATVMSTAYFGLAGMSALHEGIWSVDEDKVLPVHYGSFVLEEWLFFLLLNLILVQAVILAFDEETQERVGRLLNRE